MRRTAEATPSMRGVGVVAQDNADIPAGETEWKPVLSRPPLDRWELVLAAAFAVFSVWVVGLDLWQVFAHGRVWTGTDGIYITDQMQYLSWIVSASHSGLIADLFVVRPTSAVYLQPAILVSGTLTAAGTPPTIALLIWKPLAVGAFFLAARAYTLHVLREPGRGARVVSLTLTLFYGLIVPVYGSPGVVGDLFPNFLSWGYPFALLAVAATVYALLSYDRARTAGRVSLAPGLLGALAGSLHPWQGETFLLLVAGAELFGGGLSRDELRHWRDSPRLRLALLTGFVALIPLVYYFSLGKLNVDWALGQAASKHDSSMAVPILLTLLPLGLVAALGLRGPAGGFIGRTARLWLPAAIVIYVQGLTSQGATPLHAFDGVTLLLSLLAVNGYGRLSTERGRLRRLWPRGWRVRRRVLAGALVVFTVPATFQELREAWEAVQPVAGDANFIQPAEKHALAYLKHDRQPGGVISSPYLGMTIPGYTGRHSYDGDCIWSEPGCGNRDANTQALLAGQLDSGTAQQLVSSSHARFVLVACGSATTKLESELAPLTSSVQQFGCASVIELRPTTAVMARS